MLSKLKSVDKNLSPGLRKIIRNIGWLSAERVLSMILSFFVGVYVIRYLGPENFGKLSYSISFVALFIAISKLGLDQIVVRNLVKQEYSTSEILGTAFILKTIGSLMAVCLICITIWQSTDDLQIRKMTVIIATSLLFSSFDVLDLWFQSQVLSKSVAIVRSCQLIISSLAKLFFIFSKFSLIAFAYLLLVSSIVRAIGMTIFYFRHNQFIFNWKINKSLAISLLQDSWPLILSGVMVTIYLKIDQVMLGNMSNTQEVGNYAAAIKFSEIWYFIPLAICSSVFPSIIKVKETNITEYNKRLRQLYDLMVFLSLAIAIPMTFTSGRLMNTFLGSEYSKAGQILSLHIWSGLFIFLGLARNQWLIAENLTKIDFITRLIGALTNIFLNLILIPKYGGTGAAISTILSYAFYSYFSCFLIADLHKVGQNMTMSLLFIFNFTKNKQTIVSLIKRINKSKYHIN